MSGDYVALYDQNYGASARQALKYFLRTHLRYNHPAAHYAGRIYVGVLPARFFKRESIASQVQIKMRFLSRGHVVHL